MSKDLRGIGLRPSAQQCRSGAPGFERFGALKREKSSHCDSQQLQYLIQSRKRIKPFDHTLCDASS